VYQWGTPHGGTTHAMGEQQAFNVEIVCTPLA
jgi:hypothetical protein